MSPYLLCAFALALLVSVAIVLARTRRRLIAEQSAFAAFKLRFPAELLDADAEIARLRTEKAKLDASIHSIAALAERERQQRSIEFEARQRALEDEQRKKRDAWEQNFQSALVEYGRLKHEVEELSDAAEMQSFGLYKPRFEFLRSDEYRVKLDAIREQQKSLLRNKAAAFCGTQWQVGGSSVEGRRMVDRQMKLMLRAFNGECDAAVAGVTWKNVVPLRERIRKSFETINKLGETVQVQITIDFLKLKLDELDLAHGYAEKIQAEKEEQREIREQMREAEKAERELEREKDEAERDSGRYQKALDQARAEISKANQKERAAIDAKIEKLEALMAKAEERKQKAIAQAQLTRLGYVYILSNEGAFGPNVFKIGMTRRLEPQERVDELGSASVPFRFDVHAIIRSEDAPALEQTLHEALEPHRVNLVNHRKEYFRVPLEKIVDLVHQHHGPIEILKTPESPEYRKSLAIRAEREAMVVGKAAQASAMSRAEEIRSRFEELKKATA